MIDPNYKISVTQMWIPPSEYDTVKFAELDKPASEVCPDGMFVRMLTDTQTVLTIHNATRVEAEQMMYRA